MTSSSSRAVFVQVCTGSVAGVRSAARHGVDSVELASALLDGGITPSAGLIRRAREVFDGELVVLVRPRGGDFVYDDDEIEIMEDDTRTAARLGADGVAIGALSIDGTLNEQVMRRLIDVTGEASATMPVTLHRAFDVTVDLEASLDTASRLGVRRILTSGGANDAPSAHVMLRRLVDRAQSRNDGNALEIMAAGGVRAGHIVSLLDATGVSAIHFSASSTIESVMQFRRADVRMGSVVAPSEYERKDTDDELVREYVEQTRRV